MYIDIETEKENLLLASDPSNIKDVELRRKLQRLKDETAGE